MNEPLKLGDFAELGRMIKYIDRHDDEEIRATIKQEGEKESETAEKNLKLADDLIEETTGETTNTETLENKENSD
jgi:hypothetical protein